MDREDQLAELEAIQAIYEEEFEAINCDGESEEPLSFEVRIAVEVPETGIGVRCSFPSPVPAEDDPGTFRIEHLPPLVLAVSYPPKYPSETLPRFVLSSEWMSQRALEKVIELMLAEGGEGEAVVFSWIEVIKQRALRCALENVAGHEEHEEHGTSDSEPSSSREELLSSTGLPVVVMPSVFSNAQCVTDDAESQPPCASNAVSLCRDGRATLFALVEHDICMRKYFFNNSEHECGTCWAAKSGAECYQMERCLHVSCLECFAAFLEHHITEGTVDKLLCMEPGCKQPIPPHVIKGVVAEDLYDKYERFTLNSALAAMRDIVYCPRCEAISTIVDEGGAGEKEGEGEEDEKAASRGVGKCSSCHFAWCTTCFEAWHGGQCFANMDADKLEGKKIPRNARAEYMRRMEEKKSLREMLRSTRQCPSCNMAIQKISGCNKVMCTMCNSFMCYVCGKKITGYDHFNRAGATCVLFSDEAVQMHARVGRRLPRMNQEMLGVAVQGRKKCPRCRNLVPKFERNNHVQCWACKCQFCFLCGVLVRGTAHFSPSTCPQHS